MCDCFLEIRLICSCIGFVKALSLFGWYMTLLVIVNYLLAITLFLSTLQLWDTRIREREQRAFAVWYVVRLLLSTAFNRRLWFVCLSIHFWL